MRNRLPVIGLFVPIYFAVLSLVLVVDFMHAPVIAQTRAQIISKIDVQGSQRVDHETVRSYMELNVGDPYDSAKVNGALKALFRTGLFSDVKIFRRGSVVIVKVVENPIINRVNFEGNKEISDKDLRKEVTLRARVVFTTAKAQKDVERIITLYRRSGRFGAKVVPKIIKLSQNRVNLVYEIEEGPVTNIERINFTGNKAFNDSKLRGVIATAETAWWKFFSKADNYDPDRLNFDKELLRRHYIKNGYADFRVKSAIAELARDGKSFFITFSVEEGVLYKFGKSKVSSALRDLNIKKLSSVLLTKQGEIYDAGLIDKTIDKIAEEAGKTGFAFAKVRPKINRNRKARIIDITYEVQEGPRVYIERINVIGNVRTLDRVIRRELRLVEGDAFNRILVDRGRRRITALNFFSKVDIKQTPGSASDKVILTVKVEEKSTGALSFGAGFSTSETVIGDVSVTERNFLGRGQFLRLGTSLSFKRQNVNFKFTEPYFLGRRMTFGVDVFATETNSNTESSFKSRRVGGGFRFGFPMSEDSSITFRYFAGYDNVFSVQSTASLAVVQAAGTAFTSLVGYNWTYSTLNNPLDPSRGMKIVFTQDLAGVGGDVYYVRTSGRGVYYHPLFWENLIGKASFSAGYIEGWNGKKTRILDRFFKGSDTFRGFRRAGIGPRDLATGDALGGQVFAIGSLETIFPVGLPPELGIRGALFTDFGTLFDAPNPGIIFFKDNAALRASVGVSLIWNSPMGLIRFDLARAVKKTSYDKTEFFRFSGGTNF